MNNNMMLYIRVFMNLYWNILICKNNNNIHYVFVIYIIKQLIVFLILLINIIKDMLFN